MLFVCTLILLSTATSAAAAIQRTGRPIPNQYIVVLKHDANQDVRSRALDLASSFGGRLGLTYEELFQGFSANLTEAQAERLASHPAVQSVEEDGYIQLATLPSNPQNTPTGQSGQASLWYLDRIDQASPFDPELNSSYGWCSTQNGSGVRVYVVDTGVLPFHEEFCNVTTTGSTRCPDASRRVDPASDLRLLLDNGTDRQLGTIDDPTPSMQIGAQCWENTPNGWDTAGNAHGTAVASIIAGNDHGVAKRATIVDARTYKCGETIAPGQGAPLSRMLKVLNWIPADPLRNGATSIVNISSTWISQSYTDSTAIKATINGLVDTYNIPVIVSAGNNNDHVYWYSPSSASRAITVAGLQKINNAASETDSRWQYSNYAHMTTLYAPAQYLEAASTKVDQVVAGVGQIPRSQLDDCVTGYPSDTCTSGTSFAAPIVSGMAARYRQRFPVATRDQVLSFLHSESSTHSGVRITEPNGGTVPVAVMSGCN